MPCHVIPHNAMQRHRMLWHADGGSRRWTAMVCKAAVQMVKKVFMRTPLNVNICYLSYEYGLSPQEERVRFQQATEYLYEKFEPMFSEGLVNSIRAM